MPAPYPNFKYKYKPEYKRFRVKTPIRSFRDLDVYQQTLKFAAQIYRLELSKTDKSLQDDLDTLKEVSKQPPGLIAEAYGNRYTSLELGLQKLEKAAEIISTIVAKIDFLVALAESSDLKETLLKLLNNYQRYRRKILNLKKAWERGFAAREPTKENNV